MHCFPNTYFTMAFKHLTCEQRQIIITLKKEGKSERQIESMTGFPKSTIHSVIQKYRETGSVANKAGRGRKRMTSARQDRSLFVEMKKPRMDAELVASRSKELIGINVSPSTIRRRMYERGYHGRVARKKPYLNEYHIKRRLQFAKDHIDQPMEFWKKVIWSDESKFNLFGSDGRMFVWRRPNEE